MGLFFCFFVGIFGAELSREPATVVTVIDGDTVIVSVSNKREVVRLIGVDTPESRDNTKLRRDASRTGADKAVLIKAGKQAAKTLKERLRTGDHVFLEYDIQKRDKYNRLLAYLWTSDKDMVNVWVLEQGIANLYTVPPNVKYLDLFLVAIKQRR